VTDAVLRAHLSAFEPPGADEDPVRVAAEDLPLPEVVAAVRDATARPRR
jgi:hypothetical protein